MHLPVSKERARLLLLSYNHSNHSNFIIFLTSHHKLVSSTTSIPSPDLEECLLMLLIPQPINYPPSVEIPKNHWEWLRDQKSLHEPRNTCYHRQIIFVETQTVVENHNNLIRTCNSLLSQRLTWIVAIYIFFWIYAFFLTSAALHHSICCSFKKKQSFYTNCWKR